MSETRTATKPKPATPTPATRPSRRIILLSGTWRSFQQHFELEATIFVTTDGIANGDILWITVYAPSSPPGYRGSELVQGWARGMQLEFSGYYADPGLACDQYNIMLCGTPRSGPFVGSSVTFGQRGEMRGTYDIVEQQD
jgi:hypothetical protein